MVDYVYETDPKKPHLGSDPLFSLGAYDNLTFLHAGSYAFYGKYAPFATLSGNNTIYVNAYLLSDVSAFRTINGGSNNNHIINNFVIDTRQPIELIGTNNSVTNNGDIEGILGTAVLMRGDEFSIVNSRVISGITIGLDLEGSHGRLSSSGSLGLGGAIHGGEIAIKLTGSFNNISFGASGRILTDPGSIDGSPDGDGIGDGLILSGHSNTVQLYQVIVGGKGVSISGDRNILKLEKVVDSSGGVGSGGAYIQADVGVELKGAYNTFYNYGRIVARTTGLLIEGRASVWNDGFISSEKGSAVKIKGNDGIFSGGMGVVEGGHEAFKIDGDRNYAYLTQLNSAAGDALSVHGHNSEIRIYHINGAERAAFINGTDNKIAFGGSAKASKVGFSFLGDYNTLDVFSGGIIESSIGVRFESHHARLANFGTIIGSAGAIYVKGDRGVFNNSGIITSKTDAITILGHHNEFYSERGLIEGLGGTAAIYLIGTNNTFRLGSLANLQANSAGITADGVNNSVWIEGQLDSKHSGVEMHGAGSRVRNDGVILSRHFGVEIEGDRFELENNGLINGITAVRIEGNGGRFGGTSSAMLSAELLGLYLIGNDNTVQYMGGIESTYDIAAYIDGRNNTLNFGAISTQSGNAAALYVFGNSNRTYLWGELSSQSELGAEFIGNNLEVTIQSSGSIKSRETAIIVRGDAAKIYNFGRVEAVVQLRGVEHIVDNYKLMRGLYLYAGSMEVTNAKDGLIVSSHGILGVSVSNVDIDNLGRIAGVLNEAILLTFRDGAAADRIKIYNYSTGTIAAAGTEKVAIRVEGQGVTELTNFGTIEGSVLLGEGNDVVVNGGTIWGYLYRVIQTGGVTERVLVALDLGDGENELIHRYNGEGKVFGEIWGGEQKDRLSASTIGNVIRGWGGEDTLIGGEGQDILYGGDERDILTSEPGTLESGGDLMYGEGGDDLFLTWGQNNTLVGGAGVDVFYFSIGSDDISSHDTIRDFDVLSDLVGLNRSWFSKGPFDDPKLDPDQLIYSGQLLTPRTRLVYDFAKGDVYYDPDGSGAQESTKILHFENAPILTYLHFQALTYDTAGIF